MQIQIQIGEEAKEIQISIADAWVGALPLMIYEADQSRKIRSWIFVNNSLLVPRCECVTGTSYLR